MSIYVKSEKKKTKTKNTDGKQQEQEKKSERRATTNWLVTQSAEW